MFLWQKNRQYGGWSERSLSLLWWLSHLPLKFPFCACTAQIDSKRLWKWCRNKSSFNSNTTKERRFLSLSPTFSPIRNVHMLKGPVYAWACETPETWKYFNTLHLMRMCYFILFICLGFGFGIDFSHRKIFLLAFLFRFCICTHTATATSARVSIVRSKIIRKYYPFGDETMLWLQPPPQPQKTCETNKLNEHWAHCSARGIHIYTLVSNYFRVQALVLKTWQ